MGKFEMIGLPIVLLFIVTSVLGATWTSKRLTNNSDHSDDPAIAVNGAKIYAVWYDCTPGNWEIYFRKSIDNGATWQNAERLTNNAGSSYCPEIAIRNANVYVAWYDYTPGNAEIYFCKSADGGATWQTAKRLTNNSGNSSFPRIAASGSNVYVVWRDDTPGNEEIYFRKSTDCGVTWQASKRLTNNVGDSSRPAIAVRGANIYVAWNDYTPGNFEIFFRKSTDSGATWKTAIDVTNTAGDSFYPAIAVDGSSIFVVWHDETPGNAEIYFSMSVDGGAIWQAAKSLTHNTGASDASRIAISGANIYVVWEDNTPGNCEIFFKKSTDGGATWENARRLTSNTINDFSPDIAANDSNVYVVWQKNDFTEGDSEIFLKYSPL